MKIINLNTNSNYSIPKKTFQYLLNAYSYGLSKNIWNIKKRVTPKKGRAVAFKSDLFHSSSYSKDKSRFIVNINVCENLIKPAEHSQ